ncbi:hypothetical protein SeMB42_g02447 [Synchytrium endobioticum]|uniref:Peptidase S59 domain-containing protein n=1 Tax=Synchytrium endobioticum TaxID=286115 RepID=A0A507D7R2_9FUNG|nr:hypothetical protein SeLEV6574_g02662 [Synchytrium endobioticum]TPX49884.1 hypothetical protein SeMB42_g02447 [Synchytrium endobioticum]
MFGGGAFGGGTFGQPAQNTQPTTLFGQPQPQPQLPQNPQQPAFGFGGTTPAFGTSAAPSPFGAPAAPPAFGAPSQQPAGFGAFGQQQRPAFGATGSTSIFGATSQAPAASTGFGAFGQSSTFPQQPTTTTNVFGAKPQTNSIFGAATGSAPSTFGAPANTGLGVFGQPSTSTAFGTPASQPPSIFGTAPTSQQQQQQQQQPAAAPINQGTGQPPFTPTHDRDSTTPSAPMNIFQTITAMPAYRNHSIEELRFQDYQMGKKFGNQGGFGTTPAFGTATGSTGAFGAGTTPAFGTATSTAPSTGGLFGSTAPTQPSIFGATPQQPTGFGAFGQAPQQPVTSQPASMFAGTTNAFGTTPQAPTTGFGFGVAQQPATAAFGAFGAKPATTPAFGTAFGQAPATSQPAFGFGTATSQQPAFSAAPATGAFGSTSTAAFGTTPTNTGPGLFGQPKPATGGLFGQPATSTSGAFGANTGGLFGQQPAAGGLFGKPTAPTFGAPTSGALGFGATSAAPAAGMFGSAPAPTATGFGTPQSSLFGGASAAPAFGSAPAAAGAFGTGIFGQGTSTFGQQPRPAVSPFGGLSQAPSSTFPSFGGVQPFGQPAPGSQPFSLGAPAPSGFGMSTLGGGLGTAFGGSSQPFGASILTSTVQQPPQPLYATQDMPPWGDNPVFDKSKEEVQRSTRAGGMTILPPPGETPQKPALLPYFKVTPRVPVPTRLRPYTPAATRILWSPPGSSIFDGTVKDDIILGLDRRYTPRKNLKKLVVTPCSAGSEAISTPKLTDTIKKKASVTFDEKLERAASERGAGRLFVNVLADDAAETPQVRGNKGKAPATTPQSGSAATPGSDTSSTPASNTSQTPEKPLPNANDYLLSPSVPSLLAMTDAQLQSVKDFTITHPQYGSITFLAPVDLLSASPNGTREGIRRIPGNIVQIRYKVVIVYPDESIKPEVGRGLNVPARVELFNCWPVDKHTKKAIKDENSPQWLKHMKKLANMPNTQFVGFDNGQGIWRFRVEHFSRYGLDDDDDTEDDGATNASATEVEDNEMSGEEYEESIEQFQDSVERYDHVDGFEQDVEEDASEQDASEQEEEEAEEKAAAEKLEDYYDAIVNKYQRLGTIAGIPLRKSIVYRKDHLIADAGLSMGRSFRAGWGPGGRMVILSGNLAPGSSPDRSGLLSFVTITKVKLFGDESECVLAVERTRHVKTLSTMLDCTEMIPTIPGTIPFEQLDTDEQVDTDMLYDDDIVSLATSTPTPRAQVDENLTFESLYDACMASLLHLPSPSEADKRSPAGTTSLLKDEMKVWKLASALWDDIGVEKTSPSGIELTGEQVKVIEDGIKKERVSAWLKQAIKDSEINLVNSTEGPRAIFDFLTSRNIAKAVEICLVGRNFRLASILAQIGGAGARVLVSSSPTNNTILPPSSGHKAPGRGGTDDGVRRRVMEQLELMTQHIDKVDKDLVDIWILVSGEMDEWTGSFYSKCKTWRTTFGLFLWYANGGWSRVEEAVVSYELAMQSAASSRLGQVLATPLPAYVERGFNISKIESQGEESLAWRLLKLDANAEMTLDEVLSPYGIAPRPLDVRMAFMLSVVLMYAKAIRDARKDQSTAMEYPRFSFSDSIFLEVDSYSTMDLDTNAVAPRGVSSKFDDIVFLLSFALESLGLWPWAIYVACFASYREAREGRIRQLLEEYYPAHDVTGSCWNDVKKGVVAGAAGASADQNGVGMDVDTSESPAGGLTSSREDDDEANGEGAETWSFLVDKLKVPSTWIHEAKALRARYEGEKLREAIYLIDANHYSTAHRLIIVDIAPDFMLEGDFVRLRALLSRIPIHAAEYWMRGGGLILSYLDALDTLPALVERALSCTKSLMTINGNSSGDSPNGNARNKEHLIVSQRRARQELDEWIPRVTEMLNEFKNLNGAANGLLGGGLAWMDSIVVGCNSNGTSGGGRKGAWNQNEMVVNGRLCVAQMTSKIVDWAEKMQIITNKKILTAQVLTGLPLSEDQRLLHIQSVSSDWYNDKLRNDSF